METRSNTLLVVGVCAALLVALIAYILWASPAAGQRNRNYDVYFEKSVAGLVENSPVTLQGVMIGRVHEFDFNPVDPERIRVRVLITDNDVPIYQGTTASLDRDLFGAALITLDGPAQPGPLILPARRGLPAVIPVKRSAVDLGDPVSFAENISRTADRLNRMLTPDGRRTISDAIARLERRSADLAERAPKMAASLAGASDTMRNAAGIVEGIGAQAAAAEVKVQSLRDGKLDAVRASLQGARAGLDRLNADIKAAQPAVRQIASPTLQQQVHDLREASAGFGETVQKIDRDGLGALSPPALPDYDGK